MLPPVLESPLCPRCFPFLSQRSLGVERARATQNAPAFHAVACPTNSLRNAVELYVPGARGTGVISLAVALVSGAWYSTLGCLASCHQLVLGNWQDKQVLSRALDFGGRQPIIKAEGSERRRCKAVGERELSHVRQDHVSV